MKTILPILTLFLATSLILQAQTSIRVYEILQEKCASCHSNANPQANLDLEGSGASVNARVLDVYNNLVNISARFHTASKDPTKPRLEGHRGSGATRAIRSSAIS